MTHTNILNAGPSHWPALEIARGTMPGASIIHKLGNNPAATTREFITDSGTFTQLAAAETHNIVSASPLDTAAGTGIQIVLITGLDDNFDVISETVTLNGIINVPTLKAFIRINSIEAVTWGTGLVAAGRITAISTGTTTLAIEIAIDNFQDKSVIFQVPADHRGYVFDDRCGVVTAPAALSQIRLIRKTAIVGSKWKPVAFSLLNPTVLPTMATPRTMPVVVGPREFIGGDIRSDISVASFMSYTIVLIREGS